MKAFRTIPEAFCIVVIIFVSLPASAVEFSVPCGSSIDLEDIDGILGEEWADAQRHDCQMGKYSAEVYLKYDDEYFYVAMVIHTSKEVRGDFEGWVFFDDGDGKEYERGDDILSVVADDGKQEKADYYFKGTYDFVLDTRVGGTNNAHGAGRYDSETGWYTFEFRRELRSGDSKDVQIEDEATLDIEYGWSSY
jgi:hypothetical protein